MSLSGLEELTNIREILKSLAEGNAECNALMGDLLSLLELWPSLTTATGEEILQLIHSR